MANRVRVPTHLLACLILGAVLSAAIAGFAIRAETPGPLPPPGDFVAPVTTTYQVFGVTVGQSSGPWANSGARFGRFRSAVSTGFVIAGLLAGAGVWAVLFRENAQGTA